MDLHFVTDPEMAPRPRDDIIIEKLRAAPYGDQQRIKVELTITAFAPSDRPSLELVLVDMKNEPVSSVSIIDTMNRELSLTMHLRHKQLESGDYTLHAALYYDPNQIQHTKQTTFRLSAAD